MRKDRIRVAVFGATGNVASVCERVLLMRGIEIVAAFGKKSYIGEDLGCVLGQCSIGTKINAANEKTIAAVIGETSPDVAIDATMNTLPEIFSHVKICMERGVSVLTAGTLCYDIRRAYPKLAAELEEIGRQTGATFLGSGSAEVWYSLAMVLSGLSAEMTKITLTFRALLDGFGENSMMGIPFGSDSSQWRVLEENPEKSPWEDVGAVLLRTLGFRETGHRQRYQGLAAKTDLTPLVLGRKIDAGTLVGYADETYFNTEEGVVLKTLSYFKFAENGERNQFKVSIEGDPDLRFEIEDFHGDVTTSFIMVNRLPDLINAPGGVASVADLPILSFSGPRRLAFWGE